MRNPGTAPGGPGIALGVDGINDMDEDARKLWCAWMMAMSATAGRDSQPTPLPRPGEGLRDKTKFRAVPGRNGTTLIIPPAMP